MVRVEHGRVFIQVHWSGRRRSPWDVTRVRRILRRAPVYSAWATPDGTADPVMRLMPCVIVLRRADDWGAGVAIVLCGHPACTTPLGPILAALKLAADHEIINRYTLGIALAGVRRCLDALAEQNLRNMKTRSTRT